MFSQKERVNKTAFPILLREGRTANSDHLSLKYIENKDAKAGQGNRYSFVVSAKVSKLAVDRNLLKRRGRYIIRKYSTKIKTPISCVFFFKSGSNKLDFSQLEKEFLIILARARII
jgi:ribonuclease P protein component